MKCAVIIPIGPEQEECFEPCCGSVEQAFAHATGPFEAFDIIPIWDTSGAMAQAERWNLGIDIARTRGHEWIFFLDVNDLMNVSAFGDMECFHGALDAVWGNICENNVETGELALLKNQPMAIGSFEELLPHLPQLTLRMGHFVRTECADAVRFEDGIGADYRYYLQMWSRFRSAKVPCVLSIIRRGSQIADAAPGGAHWMAAVSPMVLAAIHERDVYCDVAFQDKLARFAIDNPFDLIQRHHVIGRFFETLELTELSGFVGRGKVIAEVGANVGNHLVFYAQHMGAKTIIPFEPNPDAIRLLDRNIKANALDGVIDRRGIGFGAGAEYGKFSVVLPQDNNLGAARLEAGSGELEVRPLDDMLAGVDIDFMKIDVEGMEFDVLEGAKKVIARCRPTMMIEVVRSRIPEFEDWCRTYAYDIAKVYNNVHAANFVVTAH